MSAVKSPSKHLFDYLYLKYSKKKNICNLVELTSSICAVELRILLPSVDCAF